MRQFFALIDELIWSTFLADNEWWMKGQSVEEAYWSQDGVIRR